MVFVGPRPFIPEHAALVKPEQEIVYSIKPGITSPASIKFINEDELLSDKKSPQAYNTEVLMPEKIAMNVDYVKRKSLLYDIKIIFCTIFRKFAE